VWDLREIDKYKVWVKVTGPLSSKRTRAMIAWQRNIEKFLPDYKLSHNCHNTTTTTTMAPQRVLML
jgi:hypothetical protein